MIKDIERELGTILNTFQINPNQKTNATSADGPITNEFCVSLSLVFSFLSLIIFGFCFIVISRKVVSPKTKIQYTLLTIFGLIAMFTRIVGLFFSLNDNMHTSWFIPQWILLSLFQLGLLVPIHSGFNIKNNINDPKVVYLYLGNIVSSFMLITLFLFHLVSTMVVARLTPASMYSSDMSTLNLTLGVGVATMMLIVEFPTSLFFQSRSQSKFRENQFWKSIRPLEGLLFFIAFVNLIVYFVYLSLFYSRTANAVVLEITISGLILAFRPLFYFSYLNSIDPQNIEKDTTLASPKVKKLIAPYPDCQDSSITSQSSTEPSITPGIVRKCLSSHSESFNQIDSTSTSSVNSSLASTESNFDSEPQITIVVEDEAPSDNMISKTMITTSKKDNDDNQQDKDNKSREKIIIDTKIHDQSKNLAVDSDNKLLNSPPRTESLSYLTQNYGRISMADSIATLETISTRSQMIM